MLFDKNVEIIQKRTAEKFPKEKMGLNRDLNPGPPAPEAGIIPLDH